MRRAAATDASRIRTTNVSTFNAANGGAVPAPQPGDSIFVHTGLGNYNGPLVLLANQRLIGQGATASLASAERFGTRGRADVARNRRLAADRSRIRRRT